MSMLLGSPIIELPGGIGFAPESGFSLSGIITDGSSVTITGSGFGTKPNGAAPLYFYELGNGVRTLDPLSRGSHDDTWESNCSLQTDEVAPNRSQSLRYTVYMDEAGHAAVSGDGGFGDLHDMGAVPDTYCFARLRMNANGFDYFAGLDIYNIKGQRNHAPADNSPVHNWSAMRNGQSNAEFGNPRSKIESMTGSDHYNGTGEQAVFGFRKNQWVTDEWQAHCGGIDVADSTWRTYRNGVPDDHEHLSSTSFIARTSPNNEDFARRMFHYQEERSGDPGFQIYWWFDFWYLDDSFCRILISEEPTYDSATADPMVEYNREPQIPTAWAPNEITFQLRQGTHLSFVEKKLYIVDPAGVAQKAGKFIQL